MCAVVVSGYIVGGECCIGNLVVLVFPEVTKKFFECFV